jgi:hypothetical protein
MSNRPTTIATYLPQFHPIPENNGWWGSGFTEWHNVVRAKPLFDGHYQPHLPADFGFYDLRVPEVREAQARAARAHGIDAFCYYHYWFEGRRPLRRVLDDVLRTGSPPMPFCLAWANENWSRHWDASSHEVLLRQRYSDEDDDAHGRFLLETMLHPLYLRVAGRPVLFIYRIQAMPDAPKTLRRWRELWRAGGLDDVQIVKFDTHGDLSDPADHGADAAAQFQPHHTLDTAERMSPPGCHPDNVVLPYEQLVEAFIGKAAPPWKRYECVVPMWDNTPRRGDRRSYVMHGSTPALYERWLSAVHSRAGADDLVLINAWNEWAEGAHLEPDLKYGDRYLRATAAAVGVTPPSWPDPLDVTDPGRPRADARFADLYLDLLEAYTATHRRLARLEGTFDRQLAMAATQLRIEATDLLTENVRLKRLLSASEEVGSGA